MAETATETLPATSPTGVRPPPAEDNAAPPVKEPAAAKKGSLEDELASLLAGTAAITDGCKDAAKDVSRVRRKSRELSAACEGLWENHNTKQDAANLWRMLGRNRRASRDDASDLSDEALRKAFNEIDTDGSGAIDKEELTVAIRKANPAASDDMIENLWKFANSNGDGEVDFDEYVKIMRLMD